VTEGQKGPVSKTQRVKRAAKKVNPRAALVLTLLIFGLTLAVTGIAMWSVPVALFVLGVAVIVYALVFIDLDTPVRRARR